MEETEVEMGANTTIAVAKGKMTVCLGKEGKAKSIHQQKGWIMSGLPRRSKMLQEHTKS